MTSAAAFRLFVWSHRIVYLGLSPDNELHRHHAAQWCVSLDRPLRYRTTTESQWSTSQGIFIPPDHPHQVHAGDARVLVLYMEPESDDYPANRSIRTLQALVLDRDEIEALRMLLGQGIDADAALATCLSVLHLESNKQRLSYDKDARVDSIVERIRREPGQSFSARELAESVHLSPSRLSHIFRKQTGIPIRRFIVWSRTRTVVHEAMQGATLTEAAHAAGFSDSAHMSNVFRGLFGFAPSVLFATDIPKDVLIVE